jgi:hypothetical protein
LITDKDGRGLGIHKVGRGDPVVVVRDEIRKD